MKVVAVWLLAVLLSGLAACDENGTPGGSGGLFGFRNLGKRAASSLGDEGGTPRR